MVSFITELSKRHKIHPRLLVAALSIIIGIVYQLYTHFTPVHLQGGIAEFAGATMVFATFVYEWFLKSIFKEMEDGTGN